MCGICGSAWSGGSPGTSQGAIERMTAKLVHRGPDDSGFYRDDHAALGFRRLSIVDLEGARQPLSNESKTVWTVFNGEIYNFPALRRRLEARGHQLRSSGDTEVLVHLYEDEGERMFALLRGMFALAIWDSSQRKLLLARDRLGQKPLFYRRDPWTITFASELKALSAIGDGTGSRRMNPLALDRYLTYGYINHPDSIFEEVHKLPPAHYAVWREGKLELERYWDPPWDVERERPIDEEAGELRSLMTESVREQMIADVPLGVFLSGGIDSTIIAGLMQQVSAQPIKTFSIGFDDPAFDESAHAATIAQRLGSDHHLFVVEPKAWETIPNLAEQYDEPFADSSALPTWYVSRETRRFVTVALSGDGGDELFGGYDRYRALALADLFNRVPRTSREWIGGPLARTIPSSVKAKTTLRKVRRWLEAIGKPPVDRYLQWIVQCDEQTRTSLYTDQWLDHLASTASAPGEDTDPFSMLSRAWDAAPSRDDPARAMIADILTYLPGDLLVKVDLASMAHSLECRAPFLDHRVVELALGVPTSHKLSLRPGRSKRVLKRASPICFRQPSLADAKWALACRSTAGSGVPSKTS